MAITSPRATAAVGYAVPQFWTVRELADLHEWLRQVAEEVNDILNLGHANAKGEVTLDANGTTTTLADLRLGATSRVFFSPTTENARAAGVPAMTAKGRQTSTLTHTNTADVDKTYDYIIFN